MKDTEPFGAPAEEASLRAGQRMMMRLAPALLLTACLALGLAWLPGLGPLDRTAHAQSIEVGGGARVAVASNRRVNVRDGPEVRPGNVVASVAGGELLRVTEAARRDAFTWYRVESLPGRAPALQGWIRGDLLTAAALAEEPAAEQTLPERLADTVNGGAERPPQAGAREPLPYAQRTDWSRDILRLYPAIEGCTRVNSAPPVSVLRAVVRSRGLAEVIMSDSAGRRWDCVINEAGGTPMRYDPLSGATFIRERLASEPFFVAARERPSLDPACYSFEPVVDPASDARLGWLFYRTCP
jgi:hypothetical protein